jgi:hypothetical protein
MPIPETILNQLKCCLYDDGHIVHEPILLKCGANACKKCIDDSIDTTLKCFSCNSNHEKNDFLNEPINKMVKSVIDLFSNDLIQYLTNLFQDLNKTLESSISLMKGLNYFLGQNFKYKYSFNF